MPTNDELQTAREAVEVAKRAVDAYLTDEQFRPRQNLHAMFAAVADAQSVLIAAQQQRIGALEAWQASAKLVLLSHAHVLQDILAPHAQIGDDMETAVKRVLTRIEELEAENSWLRRALSGFNADIQARFDAYFNEVFRVLEVNHVNTDAIYDARHNATIILSNLMRKHADALHADAPKGE